ncbi:inositol monophosphatase [Smaragdicoccus niigatensis]
MAKRSLPSLAEFAVSLTRDPQELLGIASEVLDLVWDRFVDGLCAGSAVSKDNADFATSVDLEVERIVSAELRERTGIPVLGEEFGGPDIHAGTTWVLDPIDGTFNYSAGISLAGTLLALVHEGRPIIGLIWMPLTGEKYAALEGGPVMKNGKPLPMLEPRDLATSLIGFGVFTPPMAQFLSPAFRLELFNKLNAKTDRIRISGSTGIDLAYTAAGALGGSIVFGFHPWDNAPGALLVQAAGGIVTDLAGEPWTIESTSMVAAAPRVHDELMDVIASTHCSDKSLRRISDN